MITTPSETPVPQLTIDLYADIICPWCYIGKKRLEEALAQRPELEVQVNWRAFLLNPSMPAQGMDRQAYLTAKFGHAASAVYGRIAMAGLDVGISFAFSDIARTPDTKPIHSLLIAAEKESWHLSEYFYQAYFIHGLDISNPDIQHQIYQQAGVEFPHSQQDRMNTASHQMEQDLAHSKTLGVDGVPFMVFNNAFSIAGAHPAETLLTVIDAALRPETQETPYI